jgi:hypothetical protein
MWPKIYENIVVMSSTYNIHCSKDLSQRREDIWIFLCVFCRQEFGKKKDGKNYKFLSDSLQFRSKKKKISVPKTKLIKIYNLLFFRSTALSLILIEHHHTVYVSINNLYNNDEKKTARWMENLWNFHLHEFLSFNENHHLM